MEGRNKAVEQADEINGHH